MAFLGWFYLRFQCRIVISDGVLHVKYIFMPGSSVVIRLKDIMAIDKHRSAPKRYYDKLFIQTKSGSQIIRYNISEKSDSMFIQILQSAVRQNLKRNH